MAEALALVEDQILPVLRQKKYVVIKPNLVSTIQQLATTHADTLHGVLDFLGPRFKGEVVIAESSAGNTYQAPTSSSATRRSPPSARSARSASWT